jgi:low affinity Fe/Cu permease
MTGGPDEGAQVLLINNGWNDSNEKILVSLGESASSFKWMHERSSSMYSSLHGFMSIVTIILSTSLSVESVLTDASLHNSVIIYKQVSIYIITILTLVQNFLKYEEKSTVHSNNAVKSSKFYHDIQQTLSKYRRDRGDAQKYITRMMREYDDINSGPSISSLITWQFKRNFANTPGVTGSIENIPVVSEETVVLTSGASNLRGINNCVQIQGDISDSMIKDLSQSTINKLNNQHIQNKQFEYEFSRLLKPTQ